MRAALAEDADRVVVVDNLLSAERENVPDDARVSSFVEGSIARRRRARRRSTDDFDYVFHLATYHGNQSSIADPLADHEHNLLTTLKLYEHMKDFERLASWSTRPRAARSPRTRTKTPQATQEDGAVPLDLDSPYQISKVVGEFYSVYYHRRTACRPCARGFRTSTGRARSSAPGAGAAPRRRSGGMSCRPSSTARSRDCRSSSTTGARASRDFIYVGDIVRGLIRCAEAGAPGDVYNLASGDETTILRAGELVNELTGNPTPPSSSRRATGIAPASASAVPKRRSRELGFAAAVPLEDGLLATPSGCATTSS